jgi:WD40 repeat protein
MTQKMRKKCGHFDGERNQEGGELTVEPTLVSLSPESNSTSNTTAALELNLVHKLTRNGRTYCCLAFSGDGKYLATASRSCVVSIFDSKTGKRIRWSVSVMKDLYYDEKSLPPYMCLGFSPDSKFLATGEADGNVRVRFPIPPCVTAQYLLQVWIISQRRVRNTFRHWDIVSALNFSPNGQYLHLTRQS